jgi:hypothetical protein
VTEGRTASSSGNLTVTAETPENRKVEQLKTAGMHNACIDRARKVRLSPTERTVDNTAAVDADSQKHLAWRWPRKANTLEQLKVPST